MTSPIPLLSRWCPVTRLRFLPLASLLLGALLLLAPLRGDALTLHHPLGPSLLGASGILDKSTLGSAFTCLVKEDMRPVEGERIEPAPATH